MAPILEARARSKNRHPSVKLWLDTERVRLDIPAVYRYYHQPLDPDHGCTCPDGPAWHEMSAKLRYGPRPVQEVAAGRRFITDPTCRWCADLATYSPLRYNWLWRHVNNASLTILAHRPPTIELSFKQSRRAIKFTLSNLHTNTSATTSSYIASIMDGEAIDLEIARSCLHELYKMRQHLKMELMDSYAWKAEPNPFTKLEDVGLHAIIAAVECASFDSSKLRRDGCTRLPIVPTWVRNSEKWEIVGHFLVASGDLAAWLPWMEKFGIEEKSVIKSIFIQPIQTKRKLLK